MTPKQKAVELYNKYLKLSTYMTDREIKQCALIAVDELIEEAYFTDGYYDRLEYWYNVKLEIEKL